MFATRSRAGRCADARPWRRPASWLPEPADCPRHCHTPYGLSTVVADGVALPIEEVNGRAKIKRAMARDLTVILDDRPGQLAMLGEAAGEAGVNLRGLAAFTGEGRGIIHLLVDNDASAACQTALRGAGFAIADDREVLVVDVEDRPGTLGELTRRLADANVNVDLAYTTYGGVKIVIATDDLESARDVLR